MRSIVSGISSIALGARSRAQAAPVRSVVVGALNHNQGPSRRDVLLAGTAAGTALSLGSPFSSKAADAVQYIKAANGLEYFDTKVGTGKAPVKGSAIRAHYSGSLPNGVVFDSSYDRGRPLGFTVGVGQVIKGWDLGILGSEELGIPPMQEGGIRLLRIPSDLAYGARGAGGVIPPNATLLFTVELMPRK